jgi:release factor glutamine methyltransferase
VAVAQQNAELNGVADRVRCMVADLLNLPEEAADMAPFDVITANPPYVRTNDPVAEEVAHEPHIALYGGSDGLKFLRPIIETSPDLLLPGGILALEFGFEQADDVRDLITDGDDFDEPRILLDRQQLERTAVAVRF